jgi:hypothetical protein
MITKNEIVGLAEKYLQTHNLAEFSHSFASLFYDIEQTGEPDAIQLANEIEALLAAMVAGVANDAEFPNVLKALLSSPTVTVVVTEISASTTQTMQSFFTAAAGVVVGTVKLVPFGTAPSAGFGLGIDHRVLPQTNTAQVPSQQASPA